ncbi:kinase-like domain-containing protein [Rhizophagus clarus]|nr:kinase-like domain-containing protein [Rhizophagus clarus]
MEKIKLSDDVFEQIKEFNCRRLTEEQKSLIDKLILNEELKERYKSHGLCNNCRQSNTDYNCCQPCYYKRFQQNFINWTTKEGFGTTYKAVWKDGYIKNDQLQRTGEASVALKSLHNSQDITAEFFKEVESHILTNKAFRVVHCFGITKDLKTNNFMMVMDLKSCSLRQHLNNRFNSLCWDDKVTLFGGIADGLKYIHNCGLIHHDFHCGNILSNYEKAFNSVHITDLGLCQPADVKSSQDDNNEIHGVLPYVAPEVLNGKKYTQASDVYAFGIIAYEVCTGLPPYHDMAHDNFLAIKICMGLRPKSNYKIPQLIFDIINQCWDADPSKRPKADVINKFFYDLNNDVYKRRSNYPAIHEQIREAIKINKSSSITVQSSLSSTNTLSYTTHPQAVFTSRLLNFKNLPEPKNIDYNNKMLYSETLCMDFTELNINSEDCV